MTAVTPNKAQGAILAELCHRCFAKDVFIIIYQIEIVQGTPGGKFGSIFSTLDLTIFSPRNIYLHYKTAYSRLAKLCPMKKTYLP